MGTKIVKNYPSPRLMATIGATNQSPAEAIGELVANCFDARYEDEKLNIIIDMRNSSVMVKDDGKGMTFDVLSKAVCIAEDMSKYIERGVGAKGHFGMGFKTSCATLGNFYEIYTRPASEDVEFYTHFDIGEYGRRPSNADAWDVEIEDSSPSPRLERSPLDIDQKHGTAFIIKNLKDSNIQVGSVLNYLGEAFKVHLETGDKITIIDENNSYEAKPAQIKPIKDTRIEIDQTFGGPNNDKYHITGWMALDTKTHNDGHYGFNIYRHHQLVEKFNKSWFRAHLMTSRVIGEVNMDFLDATFYKQGIQQSEDWAFVSSHMRIFLKDIVKASEKISQKGNINKPAEKRKIVNELRENYDIEGSYDNDNNIADEEGGEDFGLEEDETEKPGIKNTIKNIVSEESLILEDGTTIGIVYVEKETGGNVKAPFDYVYDPDDDDDLKAELQVLVYRDHPLWTKNIDSEVRKILATSDAIYRMLVEQNDMDPSSALKIRNEWVAKRTGTI